MDCKNGGEGATRSTPAAETFSWYRPASPVRERGLKGREERERGLTPDDENLLCSWLMKRFLKPGNTTMFDVPAV